MKRLLPAMVLLFTVQALLAQTATPADDVGAGFQLTGIPACISMLCGVVPWLIAAIWVQKDATRRNSPNKTLVTVLTWIPCTWLVGLIIHLVTRPKTIVS